MCAMLPPCTSEPQVSGEHPDTVHHIYRRLREGFCHAWR